MGSTYRSSFLLGPTLRSTNHTKGFCQVKKIQKIQEKLGSGWVGQAPTRIIICWGGIFFLFVFRVVFMFPKNKYQLDRGGGGAFGVWPIRVFLGFRIVFKLTRPLNNVMQ